jgi:hypothetical protein
VKFSLVMVKADGSAKEIPIDRETVLIGRDEGARLRIPVPSVSRRHCELGVRGSEAVVKDLGSSNGTFVNGRKVRETELEPGDLINVGPVVFVVRIDGKPEQIDAKDCYAAGSVGFDDDDDDGPPVSTSAAPSTIVSPRPSPTPAPGAGASAPKPPTGAGAGAVGAAGAGGAGATGGAGAGGAKKPLLDDDDDDEDISQLLKDFKFDEDDDDDDAGPPPKKK